MGVRAGMSGISAITGYLPQEIESYTLNAYDLCVRHKLLSNSSCTEKNVISDSVNKARFEMTNKDEWEGVL